MLPPYEAMGYGDMTPIPHEIINEMPDNRILMGYDCAEYMNMILEVTQLKRVEVPFVLIGETVGDTNKVMFDKFYTLREEDVGRLASGACDVQMVIDGHEELVPNFKERIASMVEQADGSRAIICFGHTHPQSSPWYGTYSEADYKGVIEFGDSIDPARRSVGDNRSQTLGCVIMANGDVDFMFYDRSAVNFYKFTNVSRMNAEGGEEELRNYTFKTPLPMRRR